MNSAENGILLNMMPDEEIIYRAKAGRFSFSRYLPNSTVIATNKRLFIFGPLRLFSRYSSYYYDRMEALDIKTGVLSSKFIIKSVQSQRAIIFYNKGSVLTTFNIVSNLILSTRDPNYKDKKRAHDLDMHYAVINRGTVFEAPHRDKTKTLARIVRTEPKNEQSGLDVKERKTQQIEIPRTTLETVSSVQSVVRNINQVGSKSPRARAKPSPDHKTETTDLAAAAREAIVYQNLQKSFVMGDGDINETARAKTAKISFNPDEDLEIFKQRRERMQKSRFSKFLDSFNILNPK